jgi:Mn2+/Fe2+ NRAMP family transporter
VHHTFIPEEISLVAIVTIVGGTVGGYLMFSGAHRLLDAGIKGKDNLHRVSRSALSGILISTIMRFVLFFAAVGVLAQGVVLDKDNPAATVFHFAAGEIGFRIFGIVLWGAAISSVVGASYTSISFLKTFHPVLARNERLCISVFIILTTIVFVFTGRPREALLFAGAANGLILPASLTIMLIAATRKRIMNDYRHPLWMQVMGWAVVAVMSWMGYMTIISL